MQLYDLFYKDIGIGPYHPSTGTTLRDNPELYAKEEIEFKKKREEYIKQRNKAIKRMWFGNFLRWITGRKPLIMD